MQKVSKLLIFAACFLILISSYSASISNNSLEQKTTTKEPINPKENNSSTNILKDYGPLTICADHLVYDSNNGRLVYTGNVFVLQIHNETILCKPENNQNPEYEYFDRGDGKTLKQLQESWYEHAKILCDKHKECNFISGEKLTMQLDKNRKVNTLDMETISKGELSQFYTYPVNSNPNFADSTNITSGPVNGKARKIIYDVPAKSIELDNDSYMKQNGNLYKGKKVIYDMKHDVVNIPGSTDRRSKIVLDGVEKATKIDTGLKPIKKDPKDTGEAFIGDEDGFIS